MGADSRAEATRRPAQSHARSRPLAWEALAFALALPRRSLPLAAQKNAEPPPLQQTQQNAPATSAQESEPPAASAATADAGCAQLHTGTSSGLDTEARLQNLLADHQYLRIAGAARPDLPPDQAQFYRGILANRSNQLEQSVQLLEPLVDQVTASGDIVPREAAAHDARRRLPAPWRLDQGRAGLPGSRRSTSREVELPASRTKLKCRSRCCRWPRTIRPITADPCDPFRLQVSNDPLGLIDVPVFIDARSHSWMLDPTAPFNLDLALHCARRRPRSLSRSPPRFARSPGAPSRFTQPLFRASPLAAALRCTM